MFNHNRKLNPRQKCLTAPQYRQLVANHHARLRADTTADTPVVKFFASGSATWLLSELDPETGEAFGVCDMGMGSPELGNVSLDKMCALGGTVRNPRRWVERDLWFRPSKTLTEYQAQAETSGLTGC